MKIVNSIVLGTSITLTGIAQLQAGVIAIGQFIGMTASFTILTLFALWFTIALFRSFADYSSEVTRARLQPAES